jgi:MFS superfamily sulfate permease-like transporter
VRAVPAPLVVVVVGIAVTLGLDVLAPVLAPPAQHRVDLPSLGSWAALKEAFEWPSVADLGNPGVWRLAVTLAIVASLETLLSLEAVEQIDPARRVASPDVELRAQGVGNIVAGMLGALPITAVIVRSSANVQAGARSRLSAVIHGALLLLSVFALTAVINLIPLACLAAILIVTGIKLAKPSMFLAIARQGADRFVPFAATVVGVLATDLLTGILVGIAASVALAVRANLQRPYTVARHDDQVLISFRKDVSFLAKVALKHQLRHIADGSEVVIDGSRADFVDPDVHELIDDFVAGAPARRIRVECRQLRRPAAVVLGQFPARMPWRKAVLATARK